MVPHFLKIPFTVLLLFCATMYAGSVRAQERVNDLIIKRDSSKIECRIQVVTESTVQYKKATDLQGPLFHIAKEDIAKIVYGNGETETFQLPASRRYAMDPNSVILYPSSPWLFPGFTDKLSGWTPEELKGGLNYYKTKARERKTTAIVAGSAGTLMSIIGIALIASSRRYETSSVYSYYYNDDKKEVGQLILIAGLGAGIPITLGHGISAGRYKRKAALVEAELASRNLSSSRFGFRPMINVQNRSASVSLICQF